MLLYNNGSFSTETESDMMALCGFINCESEFGTGFVKDDIYRTDNPSDGYYYELELPECYGDLEESLRNIANKCIKNHVNAKFHIEYFGDYEGAYIFDGKRFDNFSKEDLDVHNASTSDLVSELNSRGCKIYVYHEYNDSEAFGEMK